MRDVKTMADTVLAGAAPPAVALVLGSGMGGLADRIDGRSIAYADVPGMAVSGVTTHAGRFRIGTLAGRRVVAMSGRVHAYEGHSAADATLGIRVMAAMGARTIVITNAAGALDPDIAAGSVVLVEDHLSLPNLSGGDPLRGADADERFTSLNRAYSPELLVLAEAAAERIGQPIRRGVYAHVCGPSFETPAEVRMLRRLGGDVVGMSVAPETVVARALGLEVLAISGISNVCVSELDDPHVTTADEAWDTLREVGPKVGALVEAVLPELPGR